ncbi:hypothetical protein YC2023_093765 [Brassica napus]
MEVASEGTNLMKKEHPDEHIVPSLEIMDQLEKKCVLCRAGKDTCVINGDTLHNKLDGEANQSTAVCKLIQEGYMKILAAAKVIDPLTTVKAYVNSDGVANALIQHQWRPKSFNTALYVVCQRHGILPFTHRIIHKLILAWNNRVL